MDIFAKAKQLRRRATKAERILWSTLSNKQLFDYKFRSQAVIEYKYIADFYCAKKKLIIEIDGDVHLLPEVAENDRKRTLILKSAGYEVIRFTNKQVLNHISFVQQKILEQLDRM